MPTQFFACCFWATMLSFLLFAQNASAVLHPNHVSLTEIEFNQKSGKFEVAICVWPEDLSAVIKHMSKGAEVGELDDELVSRYLPNYLKEKVLLVEAGAANAENCSFRWVGSEITLKKAWLYFELKPKTSSREFRLSNRIFFERNDDQVNHVKFRSQGDAKWHRLTHKSPACAIQLDDQN